MCDYALSCFILTLAKPVAGLFDINTPEGNFGLIMLWRTSSVHPALVKSCPLINFKLIPPG